MASTAQLLVQAAGGIPTNSVKRPLRTHRAWRFGLMGSALFHGALVCAIFFRWMTSNPASSPRERGALAVEIAAMMTAPPAPMRQTPPGPPAKASVPKTERSKTAPPIKATRPDVVTPPPSESTPEKRVSEMPALEASAPQGLPAPANKQTASPVLGSSASVSPNQSWEGLVLSKLEKNKRYPGFALANHQEDVVYVRLAIDKAGNLIQAQLVRSRGLTVLDREVLSLVRRASPYPAPPASEGNPAVVVVPIEFFIKG